MRTASRRPPRCAASATPRTSPPPCSTSPAPPAATSPARCSTSHGGLQQPEHRLAARSRTCRQSSTTVRVVAVEHRQRRPARDRRHRRAAGTRAGRACGCPARDEGRPGRRRARRPRPHLGVARDQRRGRAARARAGLHRAHRDGRQPAARGDRRPQASSSRAGINVVSSGPVFLQYPNGAVPGRAHRPDRRGRRETGGASLYVNGVDPGFANDLLPLVAHVGVASASTRCAACEIARLRDVRPARR